MILAICLDTVYNKQHNNIVGTQVYIQRINRKQNGKTYTSIILARSYRENGKQKRETVAVLTKWPKHLVTALEAGLKNKQLANLQNFQYTQGKSFGGVFVMNEICKRLGITHALTRTSYGNTTLLQIMARILNNCSQRAIGNWATLNAVEEVLKMPIPTLDECYANLSLLKTKQQHIENKIYKFQHPNNQPLNIYLYDVTSSYFEGQKNELSAFGYNRDGKKGKKQVVIGLLCDTTGDPISVEVFKGNTNDLQTFSSQLQKVQQRFNLNQVIMVGDKGMIKKAQINDILENNFSYITTITKGQMHSLVKKGVFQLDMFEDKLIDIQDGHDRYIIRRNSVRQQEIAANRQQRMAVIEDMISKANNYLLKHPRAKTMTQIKRLEEKIQRFKFAKVFSLKTVDRTITLYTNTEELAKKANLDGCYAMKTNVDKKVASTSAIHDRYKDLAHVEYAFKNIKTEQLQVRPIYLRKEDRTRAHVFLCSLAYKVIKYLRDSCKSLDLTLDEILNNLKAINYIIYEVNGIEIKQLPKKLSSQQAMILKTLNMQLPKIL
ncbi:MAG: IS1634 family transposase [Proteobacteria bacterium]|nr:IS1634 family transposase [Pseudomonadota bacterium]